MESKDYFLAKLFDINYKIAIHEGNANRRLASKAPEILFQLSPSKELLPVQYKKSFNELINLIDCTLANSDGRLPIKIRNIQNKTAVKYIKLLIDVEKYLNDQAI